jgi:hypothetical protein
MKVHVNKGTLAIISLLLLSCVSVKVSDKNYITCGRFIFSDNSKLTKVILLNIDDEKQIYNSYLFKEGIFCFYNLKEGQYYIQAIEYKKPGILGYTSETIILGNKAKNEWKYDIDYENKIFYMGSFLINEQMQKRGFFSTIDTVAIKIDIISEDREKVIEVITQ